MAPLITSLASLVKQFGIGAVLAAPSGGGGISATGGVISDYLDPGPGTRYRAHIFTSSGTFTVIDPAISSVDYLVVAGGGGGGGDVAGGGGGGGFRTGSSFPVSSSPGTYMITIGAGGVGGQYNVSPRDSDPATGSPGNPSVFASGYPGVPNPIGSINTNWISFNTDRIANPYQLNATSDPQPKRGWEFGY